ncbi:MAG: ABC transporter permease subunit [Deltaproteobacteria bacterium]|nr:ABC transporter permease subunit [Deltaproteobacteria bacterium]
MRALLRLVLSRLLQGAALLLALSLALFALLDALPGDPTDAVVAADPTVSAAELDRQRALRGLDQPVVVRWAHWLVGERVPVTPPPDVMAPAVAGRLGPYPEPRRAPVFVLELPAPPPPPGTRLDPIPPLHAVGDRWRAELHLAGATRVFARVTGVDDRFAGQEGLWAMPVYVAPAAAPVAPVALPVEAQGTSAVDDDATRRAAAVAVRPLGPIARVSIPRFSGQRVAADDGDVYFADGAPSATRFRCGALCFLMGDRDALGWSWSHRVPVAALLLGPEDPVCGDGQHDPGEGCDDGNGAAGDGCDATCMPDGATLAARVDVAVAGALVSMGRVGNTLWLTVPALSFALVAALLLGAWAARRGGRIDLVVRSVAAALGSAPTYVVALALLAVVAVGLRLLPTGGLFSPGIHEQGALATLVDRLRHTLLPTVVLAAVWTGRFVRPVHAAVTAVQDADFVIAARARGLTPAQVFARHVLPHAAIPLVTLVGLSLPSLVGGALLTETLFAWPGMGRLQYDSLVQADAWVAVVVLLAHAALVVAGSLGADVVVWLLDPRLRGDEAGRPDGGRP